MNEDDKQAELWAIVRKLAARDYAFPECAGATYCLFCDGDAYFPYKFDDKGKARKDQPLFELNGFFHEESCIILRAHKLVAMDREDEHNATQPLEGISPLLLPQRKRVRDER